jgi:hypothetical protein
MNKRLLPLLWLLLLPFMALVFYVHPGLDDLSIPLMLRAGEGSRMEVFQQLMYGWNGRYTSNLLAVLSPYTWESLFGYRLALLLHFPALYFALYYLLNRLLSPLNAQPGIQSSPSLSTPPGPPAAPSSLTSHVSSLTSHLSSLPSHFSSLTSLLSAALLLLYLHWLPDITESIYWLSGAMVYTWALIVQLLVLALMAASLEKPTRNKTILLALLLFLASGFNEIALAINLLLAFGYWLLAAPRLRLRLRLREPHAPSPRPHAFSHFSLLISHFSPLFLSVLLAAAIVLSSPGNTGRMYHFPGGGDVLATLTIAAVSTGKLLGVMAQNLPLLLFGFLLLPHLHSDALRPALRPLARMHPLWVAALGLLFLFACMVVPAWAMGMNPPLRIYNYLGLFFMGFFFWGLFCLHAWLHKKQIALYPAFTGWGRAALILIIFLAMAFDFHKQPTPFGGKTDTETLYIYRGNLPRVTSDLFLRARPYSEALQKRQAYVNQQKALGKDSLTVPPIPNPPTSILFLDITTDPTHWINMLQAEWYGLEQIAVDSD